MRTLLAAAMLMAVPFVGCLDGGDETVAVDWLNMPEDTETGHAIDVRWTLEGPEGEIQHTGVHYGTTSVSDPQSPADYAQAAGVTEPADVPGTYDASITLNEAGTYYFRAHAIADGEHVWTDEVSITVSQATSPTVPVTVSITDSPDNVTRGDQAEVTWQLTSSPGEIQHTGFHYAASSVHDPHTPADYGNTSGLSEPADVPGTYTANFTVDTNASMLYGRAHAIKEGEHYWSDEIAIEVTPRGNDTGDDNETEGETHTVEMEDTLGLLQFQFSPAELTVQQGDTIVWDNVGETVHTATFNDTTLGDSGDVEPGANYTLVIPMDLAPGEYPYVCTYHEGSGMTGTITVEART